MEQEIIISGLSGRFPESENVQEFWSNLIQGVDMVTSNDKRWPQGFAGLPHRKGTLKNSLDEFDAEFFGMHRKLTEGTDPRLRQLLEVTWEAIFDSGINPAELRSRAIGVYVGVSTQETMEAARANLGIITPYDTLGSAGCMMANRVSFSFDFRGPSVCVDTYCSSSLVALHLAVQAVRLGECEGAIVAGINLMLNPLTSAQIQSIGVLAEDGKCKSFDVAGDGYVQSEAIAAIYITRKSLANRCYATILNTRTNTDGYKENGITCPSSDVQELLMRQTYKEAGIRPADVFYVEAHGTGTAVGDVQELEAISSVFCENRSSRLLIGSTKSNMGHAEAAASIASVIKVVLSIQHGIIPANLHFKNPNPNIPSLHDGRLKVVTEATDVEGDLFGICASGLGGTNVHVILKGQGHSAPRLETTLPILIPFSARTQDGVQKALDKLALDWDADSTRLLSRIHELPVDNHKYRGFVAHEPNRKVSVVSELVGDPNRPLWLIFPGIGTQWPGMGKEIMEIEVIRRSLEKSAEILKPFGIDLIDLIVNHSEEGLKHHVTVAFTAVGIALVDFIKTLNLTPEGYIGHSAGEALCAYLDGCASHEEILLCQHHKEVLLNDLDGDCGMASVGLTWEEAHAQCPESIYVACHNAQDNVTLAGRQAELAEFVDLLKSKGIFAKLVPSGGLAFHSPYVSHLAGKLESFLREKVKGQRPISPKWNTTAVEDRETQLGKFFSPEYILHQFVSPVLFHSAVTRIPPNAIVLEIGSHSLFQTILKRTLPSTVTLIPTMKRNSSDNLSRIYTAVGTLFINGLQPKFTAILPISKDKMTTNPEFLAGNSKTSIASLVTWDHSQKYRLPDYMNKATGDQVTKISLLEPEWEFLKGHKIDGRILFPATGYLVLAWKSYASLIRKPWKSFGVQFENVVFHRATVLNLENSVDLVVSTLKSCGDFQITESDSIVVTGRIQILDEKDSENVAPAPAPLSEFDLDGKDFYKDLRLRGYEYSEDFQGILGSDVSGNFGSVRCQSELVAFLDTLLQFHIFSSPQSAAGVYLPTRLKNVTIQPRIFEHLKMAEKFEVTCDRNSSSVSTFGIQLEGIKISSIPRRKKTEIGPILQNWAFVPYIHENQSHPFKFLDAIKVSIDIVLENLATKNLIMDVVCADAELKSSLLEAITAFTKLWPEKKICNNPNSEADVVILKNIENLEKIMNNNQQIKGDGFILIISQTEIRNFGILKTNNQQFGSFILVSTKITLEGYIYLLRKVPADLTPEVIIPVSNTSYDWLLPLQEAISMATLSSRIWLTTSERDTGLIGLINCLRKEPGGQVIRCLISPQPEVTQKLKNSDLVMNILDPGLGFGSYRSLGLEANPNSFSAHAYLNVQNKGDLSTVAWIEAPVSRIVPNRVDCAVYYAPLNFRDIMLATGKLSPDALPGDIGREDCVLGLEFCGIDAHGQRAMGVVPSKGLSTHVQADSKFTWTVPEDWTLAEGSTVPVAYSTAYYSLIMRGKLQCGDSVLITSGTGSVGQAAITIAQSLNCQIFTTVGSAEKKEWLSKKFPEINTDYILNSRNTEFAREILKMTNQRGVDVVLNSLAEEKLQAALSCIANGGRFLEIGKFDLSQNTPLGMEIFLRNISFHGILIDALFGNSQEVEAQKLELWNLVAEGIQNGVVQPLPVTIFDQAHAQDAFRFMASGRHMGKVVLQLRNENESLPVLNAVSRTYFDPEKVYILIGGLGGFGLELTSWMVTRGVRNVVLVSRTGISNGYKKLQISRFERSRVKVLVSNEDLKNLDEVETFFKKYAAFGAIGGIFNLAMVLKDGLLENQNAENFEAVLKPKYVLTKLLDEASRKFCPELDYFVAFSSVTSVFGNAGQSNYGFGNSTIERICAQRHKDGLPGLAIAWGAIGDVGVVHDRMGGASTIGGTVPQPLTSCLQVLDTLLHTQFKGHKGIISSMVLPAEGESDLGSKVTTKLTLRQKIGNMLGLSEGTLESKKESTLSELGLDSLMLMEAKAAISEFKIENMSTSQIRKLTWEKLMEIENNNQN